MQSGVDRSRVEWRRERSESGGRQLDRRQQKRRNVEKEREREKDGERERERDGEGGGGGRKGRSSWPENGVSAMLARTYVDRVLNYVLESCTFHIDIPGFV